MLRTTSSFLLCAAVLLGGSLLVRPAIAQQALPTAPAQAAPDSVLARATQTASGMRYAIRQPGTGAVAQPGDRVLVHYTGFLPSGRIFDASVRQGGPLKIRAGRGEVIKGWDEVLLLLPQGARRACGPGPAGLRRQRCARP
ncbi:FKBP-type peptidyl-prolyl cis-trans isomerase [Hymenobacter sp. AT01-02]|uniref:FKBP-type peptidyl-prolyl cis-trans isomerase n=1 Tax=Hymenobacter sp. AT01-02 TaxID=1571877 RepID=UPI00069898E6|nr:FKBP-type peptidyl-prolyl cis-trans isomerase [Hymenobacter sp. AT01-02]